jgi:hypoxanthine phosphoribosyltransferase
MNMIEIDGLQFELLISSQQILDKISLIADDIKFHHKNELPIFLIVLNGASVFAAELLKHLDPQVEISMIKVHSYDGSSSTGNISIDYIPSGRVLGRDVLLIEDIVDSGLTLNFLTRELKLHGAKTVSCASLLFKPNKYKYNIVPNYIGFEIGDEFVVGYGMDFNQKGRALKHIYKNIINLN